MSDEREVIVVGGGQAGLAIGYLEATGLMSRTVESRVGQRMQHREMLIGSSPRVARRRHGIQLRGRTVEASGGEVRFGPRSTAVPA